MTNMSFISQRQTRKYSNNFGTTNQNKKKEIEASA